ncbi:hypothetical protein evm_014557, partial [Chilo suppressalis]
MPESTPTYIDGSIVPVPRYGDHKRDHLHHHVKQEPDHASGCDSVMQPQGSPFYAGNAHNNVPSGYYHEPLSRPGPELLIAKQNALAAHTQL